MFENGRNEERLQVSRYLIDPATIHTTERAAYWGNIAIEAIEDCKAMIRKLEQYQQMLYERVQQIETAPYHHRVTLLRQRGFYDKKVTYHLIVEKVRESGDIKPEEIQRTKYPGTERRQALADFESYKKTHPGIESIKDIEKSKWER